MAVARAEVTHPSGRYAGVCGEWRLELRLDIEGPTALDIISGDLWRQQQHLGRFLTRSGLTAELSSGGSFTIRLSHGPHAHVDVTTECGQTLAIPCHRFSPFFRDITLQPAVERDLASHWFADGFGMLPRLTEIYAQAGIGLTWNEPRIVEKPTSAPGWTESDLRETLGASLLLAGRYQGAANIRGIKVENGCAVFLHAIGDYSEAARRHALFTCVHEIGHLLQLPHALPAECSWMSVPSRYPGGEERFFSDFDSVFLYQELRYLRHGAR